MIFGKLLAEEPGLREKMFIQSKCAIHDGLYDFDGDYIRRSVDGILTRLQTDHLDSLLLRYPARMQVVLGTTNPARVKSAAKAAEITLTKGEWYALYKAAGNKLP